jgi:hypothetical protein
MECKQWLVGILSGGTEVRVPEIADYELRRELIRVNSVKALARLDELGQALGYVALSTPMIRRAAEFWANARNLGLPTAPDHALDGDVILAAQVAVSASDQDPVVATTNVKHLERFVAARLWRDIAADGGA